MALEKSILNNDIISNILNKEYGIIVDEIKKIDRGSANIYELFSATDHYVLKEFQSKIDFDRVNIEYLICKKLEGIVPVPEYVLTLNGKIYTVFDKKILIVQKFIDGKVKNFNSSNKYDIIKSVCIYGKIIQELKEYKKTLPMFKKHQMSKKQCIEDIRNIDKLIKSTNDKNIIDSLLHKKRILYRMKNLDFSWQKKITYRKSHGDFTISQFIYNKNNEIVGIIDWVSARKIPIARELIRNYFFMAKEIKKQKIDIEFFVKYIKEFFKYEELNFYDLKYMALLYLIELSRSTYGYEQYIKTGNQKLLDYGYELYNQCICLGNNLDCITNALINLYKERI